MKSRRRIFTLALLVLSSALVLGTPANKAALQKYYDRFLISDLNRCTTCHLPSDKKDPETLDEFPHNPFGHRLRLLGEDLEKSGKGNSMAARLAQVSREDADGDGVPNEMEILLGHNPGDAKDRPSEKEIAELGPREKDFAVFLTSYRWKPFESVQRPEVPRVKDESWVRNPIDAFVSNEHEKRKLKARPEASKPVLLRRVYLDLVGLTPTLAEQEQFLNDHSTDAYEKLVDRLLEDQRYGERWGRHWMDVWRYSDWAGWSGGNQIRDSKPHIWRWRDWIIESLNNDKGYNRMLMEMLAADELCPEDTNALRATGFLVRNYKMLSREQWLEDTVKHTSQAFLGVTMGCAKCHDHKYDPITQAEYYQMRAIFEPHQVRTDRVPGELDTGKNGLVRVFDTLTNTTYFFIRGDERRPDTNRVMKPGVPRSLSWANYKYESETVPLPKFAAYPDKRDFVIHDVLSEAEAELKKARNEYEKAGSSESGDKVELAQFRVAVAEAKLDGIQKVLELEKFDEGGKKDSEEWQRAARDAYARQKFAGVLEAKLNVREVEHELKVAEAKKTDQKGEEKKRKETAALKKKLDEARKSLGDAEKALEAAPGLNFQPRATESFPEKSTGRRLAFAKWVTDERNPLAARVAVNHVWLRHFGRGIVPNPADFGANAAPPSNPQLLDWLAAEFMSEGWSMKKLHRLILTSSTYRMASTPDEEDLKIDPDNIYLWRMSSRRLDAELVRDNLLHVAGNMDYTMGGPEIDHNLGLTSKRRSVYLRIAAEKEVEFLKIFDGPAVTECYMRHPTVMPQQALALANSDLALSQAKFLAQKLSSEKDDDEFVRALFKRGLAREVNDEELKYCREFLEKKENKERARENLVLVLFNHNDFVTVR
jgi:hypothetical protein